MADPIMDIVVEQAKPWPSQTDPAQFDMWADYHERRADKIAAQPPGETEAVRLGQLQGEMDHRSAAAGFREEKLKVAARLPDMASETADSRRQSVTEDTRTAFLDLGIPEQFVDYAVTTGNLEGKDTGEREAFYNQILDSKRDLDEVANGREEGAEQRQLEGVNDWKSAISVAAIAGPKAVVEESWLEPENVRALGSEPLPEKPAIAEAAVDHTAVNVKAGLQTAQAHWDPEAMRAAEIRVKYPLLTNDQDALNVSRAGARRAWLVSLIPDNWQRQLGLSVERTYDKGVEAAYRKLMDKKADELLGQRIRTLSTLRGVNPAMDPHLLPSKQYRAAENLTRIDQELRRIRPLPSAQYAAAVDAARGLETARGTQQNRQQQAAQKAPGQTQALTVPSPQVKMAEQVAAVPIASSKHEEALRAVREIQGRIPVDGFRSKATDAMTKNIISQLQEQRSSLSLSGHYADGDQGRANKTHAAAVDANQEIIEAVRKSGIPVDTGKATVSAVKKPEVAQSLQAGLDQSVQTLQ